MKLRAYEPILGPKYRGFRGNDHFSENDIRCIAYQLWEEAGCPDGMSDHFWFEAEEHARRILGPNWDQPGPEAGWYYCAPPSVPRN